MRRGRDQTGQASTEYALLLGGITALVLLLGAVVLRGIPQPGPALGAAEWAVLEADSDPDAVSRVVGSLDRDERARLAATRPGLVGGLDGAPAWMRVSANRMRTGAADLLLYDASAFAGDGVVAVVAGDLDRARHVAVLIPGTGTDIGDVALLRATAAALHRVAQAATVEPVAVVVWLGYDAPDRIVPHAARSSYAAAAAPSLRRFVDGLRAARRSAPVHVTVIGHSYGSVVMGHALRRGLAVDDAVALGSPGLGRGVNRARDLHTGARLWASAASLDPVPFAPVHGENPASRGFGARLLPAPASGGHRDYLAPGTASLAATVRVITTP